MVPSESEEVARPATSGGSPWGHLVGPVIIGLVAWASNPDQAALERAWGDHYSEAMKEAEAGLIEKFVAQAVISVSVERRDYFFFSIGEMKASVRFTDHQATGYAFGAFGYWWF